MTALALIHKDKIISDLHQGKYLKDIAIDLGVTKQALSQYLKDDPEYQTAREEGVAERLDKAAILLEQITLDANIRIEDAKQLLDLARIREIGLKRQEWRAEREFPARWGGQKLSINIINGVQMDEALVNEAGELLEHIKG